MIAVHATTATLAGEFALTILWLTTVRYVGGMVLALVMGAWTSGGLSFVRTRHLGFQLARSALLAMVTVGAFVGATRLPLPVVTALGFSWPAMATVWGWVSRVEAPSRAKALSVAVCATGVTALATTAGATDAAGILIVLTGATANAAQVVLNRRLALLNESAATSTFYMGVGGVAVVAGWWLIAPSSPLPALGLQGTLLLVAVPAVSVLGQTLYALAQARVETAQLAPLTYIFQLPFSAAVGVWVLDQPAPTVPRLVAMATIVVGALIAYWPKRLAA
ncbi:MAG: DMT family transporter [Burkholderiaceae bacterium]|nr:DMT family transporter [Aquabacterium sp.]NUP84955.1 DMT family transporter [Burkholderiaceae bacterium]